MSNRPFLSTKTTRILLPILVSLISFLAYLNTLHHQFVFDDFRIIVNNPFIKGLEVLSALFLTTIISKFLGNSATVRLLPARILRITLYGVLTPLDSI